VLVIVCLTWRTWDTRLCRHPAPRVKSAFGSLGARTAVFKMVAGDAAVSVGLGLAVGVVAAVALHRYAASLLYGTAGVDGLRIASGALLMALVSAVATFLPTHRATSIDPVDVLREV
jgi:putative ABC transport system permease protein